MAWEVLGNPHVLKCILCEVATPIKTVRKIVEASRRRKLKDLDEIKLSRNLKWKIDWGVMDRVAILTLSGMMLDTDYLLPGIVKKPTMYYVHLNGYPWAR